MRAGGRRRRARPGRPRREQEQPHEGSLRDLLRPTRQSVAVYNGKLATKYLMVVYGLNEARCIHQEIEVTIVSMCGYLVTHLDSMYSFYSSFYGRLEANSISIAMSAIPTDRKSVV